MHAHNFKDLSGQRFGKRVVLSFNSVSVYKGKRGSSLWNVVCDCGKKSVVITSTLKSTTSCGCDESYAKISGQTRRSPIPKNIRSNDGHRKTHYKLSPDDFQKLIDIQNNKCRICQETFIRTPHIDHDHLCCPGARSCGKCIRGLLCHSCNCGLGNFHDNLDLMNRAIDYLSTKRLYVCTNQAFGVRQDAQPCGRRLRALYNC